MTPLARTGYVDTFARDHLPPPGRWPALEFTTDLLKYPERLNAAAELIDVPAAVYGPDRPALRTPDGTVWTYGELRARSSQIARVLTEDLGLVTGNRVLLRSPNNPWTVAAWLGVLKAGGIVVTTMAALRARELAPIIAKTRPRSRSSTTATPTTCYAAARQRRPRPADRRLRRRRRRRPDRAASRASRATSPTSDTAADDVALFCPTSGSTGVPKITTHFHRDLLSIDNTFGRHACGCEPDDLVACTAPFAFTFGLGMLVVFPLRAGACALLTEAATPVQLADIVAEHRRHRAGHRADRLQADPAGGPAGQLSGLRAAVSAGEHIPRETWQQLRDEVGLEVIDGIGAHRAAAHLHHRGRRRHPAGATGKPVPGFRAAILDADGNEAAPGAGGGWR